ncbi:MAG TPA: amidohydrolase [Polyangium sp.]|nr:amidohydrolase [Polyangium sp.]
MCLLVFRAGVLASLVMFVSFSRQHSLVPLFITLAACASTSPPPAIAPDSESWDTIQTTTQPFPWEVANGADWQEPPLPTSIPSILIRNATLMLATGKTIPRGNIWLSGGQITAISESAIPVPEGTQIIDGAGKFVTPGIIDTHSHIGVYAMPDTTAHDDGNEVSAPVTADVHTADAFWPQDPAIERAVAGGVTTFQILPGSANLVGGRAITLKLRPEQSAKLMHFRGAPDGLKMACGENPKRTYGKGRNSAPRTRMGNLAMQRKAFLEAKKLEEEWTRYRAAEAKRIGEDKRAQSNYFNELDLRRTQQAKCKADPYFSACDDWQKNWDKPISPPMPSVAGSPPARDPVKETLIGVIQGKILLHVHCYRADDMLAMISLADEIGFKIRSFHHALEAYKIRDVLAQRKISVSTWADWWGFKMEAYDGIPENLALVQEIGGMPILHTDSPEGIQRMNQEAGKAVSSGRKVGIPITDEDAIRWLTANPAWALGIDDRTGTLEVGKDADVVLWDRHPFSVYASAERVWIDGITVRDKTKPRPPWSDFELGQNNGLEPSLLPGGAR